MSRFSWLASGFFASFVLLVLAMPSTASTMPGVPESNQIIFEVYMEGDFVGRDTYTFRRTKDELEVHRAVDLSSSWGPINLFTYRHESRGWWKSEQLQRLEATTDYNGETTRVRVDRNDTELVIRKGEGTGTFEGRILPTTWWNPSTRSAKRLLDTQRGRIRSVEIVHRGTERVPHEKSTVTADRYDVRKDLELSLWYGPDRELMSIEFVRKGYTFRYRRVQ